MGCTLQFFYWLYQLKRTTVFHTNCRSSLLIIRVKCLEHDNDLARSFQRGSRYINILFQLEGSMHKFGLVRRK